MLKTTASKTKTHIACISVFCVAVAFLFVLLTQSKSDPGHLEARNAFRAAPQISQYSSQKNIDIVPSNDAVAFQNDAQYVGAVEKISEPDLSKPETKSVDYSANSMGSAPNSPRKGKMLTDEEINDFRINLVVPGCTNCTKVFQHINQLSGNIFGFADLVQISGGHEVSSPRNLELVKTYSYRMALKVINPDLSDAIWDLEDMTGKLYSPEEIMALTKSQDFKQYLATWVDSRLESLQDSNDVLREANQ